MACHEWAAPLPQEVFDSSWLGFSGATEQQIALAEARLNIRLPPSYREFLKVSNGWRQTTPFIYRVLAVEEIQWLRVRHPEWIASFKERFNKERLSPVQEAPHASTILNGNGMFHGYSIPDAEYFIYGSEQDCSKIRLEYLDTSLVISERGESSIYLLNPNVIHGKGEWEAWFFGDWLPGADRYPSFLEMMMAEYRNFLEMRETL